MTENGPPERSGRSAGRVAAARVRIEHARSSVIASRTRFRSVDVAFEISGRDRATGGAVLAGAIAFRLFLWTLPATLVTVGLIGFSSGDAEADAKDLGVGAATAHAVGTAAEQAQRGRWLLVIIGVALLVSVSRTLGVTVHTAIAMTWQLPIVKVGRYLVVAAVTAGILGGVLLVAAFTSYARHESDVLGLAVALLVVLLWTGSWWAISVLLPHPPLPWWGLLPGAALVGVGMEIMHLVAIFYLEPRVTSSSALYGSLGLAATLLLGAYILARLLLASAGLNATLHAKFGQSAATEQQS
jgi:uncharacterized BrkB/YihY/UPF0761 family membrane protein